MSVIKSVILSNVSRGTWQTSDGFRVIKSDGIFWLMEPEARTTEDGYDSIDDVKHDIALRRFVRSGATVPDGTPLGGTAHLEPFLF
jgi:hypothetical protein